MKQIITIYFLFLSTFIFSQEKTNTSMNTFMKVDLGGSGIGLSLETPISNKFLFEVETGLGGGYNVSSDQFKYIVDFGNPAFYTSLKGKFYYNRAKRLEKGKGLFMNAGNFVGIRLKYATGGIFGEDIYSFSYPYSGYYYDSDTKFKTVLGNIHWGIQRQLGKHWMYTFHLGLGYAYDIDYETGTLYPAVDIKFSYVLPLFGKK